MDHENIVLIAVQLGGKVEFPCKTKPDENSGTHTQPVKTQPIRNSRQPTEAEIMLQKQKELRLPKSSIN